MIEIIPNWHPIFVHFTVALLSMAVLLYIFAALTKEGPRRQAAYQVAAWNLWIGAVFTLITVAAGWYAYNTVAHDTASHAAMTVHRNWALATVAMLAVTVIWVWRAEKTNSARPSMALLSLLLVMQVLLATTAWHGGEVVYRYGLGVMSMPKTEGAGHAHEHANGESHGHESIDAAATVKPDKHHDDHSNHNHKH